MTVVTPASVFAGFNNVFTDVSKVSCFADVAAPVGRTELETTTAPVFTAVTLLFKDVRVASMETCPDNVDAPVGNETVPEMFVTFQVPDWVDATVESGVSVDNWAAVKTIGIDDAANACPRTGNLPSIDERLELPVVCNALVAADAFNGIEANETG